MANAATAKAFPLATASYLIWLDDVTVTCNEEKRKSMESKLRAAFNYNNIRTFEDEIECEEYIAQCSSKDRVTLLASEEKAKKILPHIYNLGQVVSVYIHYSDEVNDEEWADQRFKVKCISTCYDDIISRVTLEQKRRDRYLDEPFIFCAACNIDESNTNNYNNNNDDERSTMCLNAEFLNNTLFIAHLLTNGNKKDRQNFIDMCRKESKGDVTALALIEEFKEKYSPEHALEWYTKPSPVYKILNKATRMRNPHVVLPCCFFIRDLFDQLKQLQRQQSFTPLRVYRGQLISSEELGILMSLEGHIVTMNSFLSTTLNRDLALFLLGDSTHAREDDLSFVLYEIDLQPCVDDRIPFANISEKSMFPEEEEVLIMLNALFRIQNFTYESQIATWVVHMNFCNSDDPYLKQLPGYELLVSARARMENYNPRNDPFLLMTDAHVKLHYESGKRDNAFSSPHDECSLS